MTNWIPLGYLAVALVPFCFFASIICSVLLDRQAKKHQDPVRPTDDLLPRFHARSPSTRQPQNQQPQQQQHHPESHFPQHREAAHSPAASPSNARESRLSWLSQAAMVRGSPARETARGARDDPPRVPMQQQQQQHARVGSIGSIDVELGVLATTYTMHANPQNSAVGRLGDVWAADSTGVSGLGRVDGTAAGGALRTPPSALGRSLTGR